jgi:tryptophanyl-tRNA synthetase
MKKKVEKKKRKKKKNGGKKSFIFYILCKKCHFLKFFFYKESVVYYFSMAVLLSGVKPTGKPHLGNYLGAMRQFVDLSKTHTSYVFIANYHALNTVQNSSLLREYTHEIILDYLALGLSPQNVVLFKQSDVYQHTELCWIFNAITTMPYLMRAHAYKDAVAKKAEVSVGTFDYPILMAADILLYSPDIVPVGKDQKQHIEYARDIALHFNSLFGETFSLPKEYIVKDVETVKGIDGRKMSKSYNNTIPLFGTDEEIRTQCMRITTGSLPLGSPLPTEDCLVFALHKHFSQKDVPLLEKRYKEGSIGYKESKEILADNIIHFISPLREKRNSLAKDFSFIDSLLKEGAEKARIIAHKKMEEVRKNIGVS